MAVKYLKSGASGTADGSSWANAYLTLAAALAGVSAGDTIYVSDNHAETQTGTMVLTSPGTVSAPVRILCVDDSAEPPTTLATTATITTTDSASAITIHRYAYFYGVTISCGTGGNSMSFNLATSTALASCLIFDSCILAMGASWNANRIAVGPSASTSGDENFVKFINTSVKFANVNQGINLRAGRFIWENSTAIAAGGTTPTTLFISASTELGATADCRGIDFSGLGSGNIITGTESSNNTYQLSNCKLGSSAVVKSGTITAPGGVEIYLDNCDSADTNYRMEHYKYEGSILANSATYLTAGATNGTTHISWKMITLATGPTFEFPLISKPIYIWNETTGSQITATIEILHDSATNLEDDEVWVEVEYLGTSGVPLGAMINDRVTNPLASLVSGVGNGTAQTAGVGSGSWTISPGMTNANSQKLSVSFTPQEKGYLAARIYLAKANYTIFIDPKITIS